MREKEHKYKGKIVTSKWLAAKAGVSVSCINHRLKSMKPEQAVALGPIISHNRYPYKGQMLTAAELAKIAGCKKTVMSSRLNKSPDAERAVAMGKEDRRGGSKNWFTWQGKRCDYDDLAKIRHCAVETMRRRVRTMGLERAMSNESIPQKNPKPKQNKSETGNWGDLHEKARPENFKNIPKPTRFDLAYGV